RASSPDLPDSRDSMTSPRTVAPAGIRTRPSGARIGSVNVAVNAEPIRWLLVLNCSSSRTPKVVPAGTVYVDTRGWTGTGAGDGAVAGGGELGRGVVACRGGLGGGGVCAGLGVGDGVGDGVGVDAAAGGTEGVFTASSGMSVSVTRRVVSGCNASSSSR